MTNTPAASLRERTAHQLNRPGADAALVVGIALSVLVLFAEAAVGPGRLGATLWIVSDVITALFGLDLLLRFWVAPRRGRFLWRYAVDIVSVVPILPFLPWHEQLRLLLLLRLFRVGQVLNRYLTARRGVGRVPFSELSVLSTITLFVVLGAALVLETLPGAVHLETEGLEGSLWYSIYTLISLQPTGGNPASDAGRAVTLALMVSGIAVFGVFVGAISAATLSFLARRLEREPMDLDELSGHVIICGWNNSGAPLLSELYASGPEDRVVIVVTEHESPPRDLYPPGLPHHLIVHHHGDPTRLDVLDHVGVRRAAIAILLSDNTAPRSVQDRDARTVLTALTIERLNTELFCCAELLNEQHAPLLRLAGVEEVVVSDWMTGVILGSVGRTRGLVPVLTDLFSATHGNGFHKVPVPVSYAGWTIAKMHDWLKNHREAILVSLDRNEGGRRCSQHVNPAANTTLQPGDTLLVIARHPFELPDPAPER